jgi:hypothetical protein
MNIQYIKVTSKYGDELLRLESRNSITKEIVTRFLGSLVTSNKIDDFETWELAGAPHVYEI